MGKSLAAPQWTPRGLGKRDLNRFPMVLCRKIYLVLFWLQYKVRIANTLWIQSLSKKESKGLLTTHGISVGNAP